MVLSHPYSGFLWNLVHNIVLYRMIRQLLLLFSLIWTHHRDKWDSHHLYNQTDCVTTREVLVKNEISNLGLLPNRVTVFFPFILFQRQHYLFYQFHKARVFLEVICHKVDIQKNSIQNSFRLLWILDHVLWSLNASQSLWIWWTTDPASLAKWELCSSHASLTRRGLCCTLALSI